MADSSKDNKTIILDILKKSSSRISGEELSRITSISRVGVWKHINSLKEHGYEIDSNRNGYFLKKGKDLLQIWEFPKYRDRILFFPELESTMKKAKSLALDGACDRTIIAAEKQTDGKDLKGEKWESDEGGLYFTLILRPELPLSCYNLINLASSIGIYNYLKSLDIESSCRWPNEIIAGNKKISGILTEISGLPDRIEYALVGIGLNINNSSSGISLKEILERDFPRKEALNNLLVNIFEVYDSGFEKIPEIYSSCMDSGRDTVKYLAGKRVVKGTVKSVTREGNLLVCTPDGKDEIILPGDRRISGQT